MSCDVGEVTESLENEREFLLTAREFLVSAWEFLVSAWEFLLRAREYLLRAREFLLRAKEFLLTARECTFISIREFSIPSNANVPRIRCLPLSRTSHSKGICLAGSISCLHNLQILLKESRDVQH